MPESSIFGSICCGGFAARPTFVGKTFIDKTSGAMLRAMNARLTSLSEELAVCRVARHWKYRAFGLATAHLLDQSSGAPRAPCFVRFLGVAGSSLNRRHYRANATKCVPKSPLPLHPARRNHKFLRRRFRTESEQRSLIARCRDEARTGRLQIVEI